MKKTMKRSSGVVIAALFFAIGALTAAVWLKADKNSGNNKEAGIGTDAVQKEEEREEKEEEEAAEECWGPALTEEDRSFLEEHLYGQWTFSERLFTLYDSTEILGNYEFNFSDEGVEALKKVRITYEEDYVGMRYGQDSFTNHRDFFLFGAYGGLNSVRHPVFHMGGKSDGSRLRLNVIYIPEGQYVQLPEKKELVKVYYNLGYDVNVNPSVMGDYAGMHVYIDPNDTETIYLDFCGLWRMERDRNNYNTNGKQFDSGL